MFRAAIRLSAAEKRPAVRIRPKAKSAADLSAALLIYLIYLIDLI
jgi:hypothetical protein